MNTAENKKDFREDKELIKALRDGAKRIDKNVVDFELENNGGLQITQIPEAGKAHYFNIWLRKNQINLRVGRESDIYKNNADVFTSAEHNSTKSDKKECKVSFKSLDDYNAFINLLRVDVTKKPATKKAMAKKADKSA